LRPAGARLSKSFAGPYGVLPRTGGLFNIVKRECIRSVRALVLFVSGFGPGRQDKAFGLRWFAMGIGLTADVRWMRLKQKWSL
jgi:hypothetical protein